MLLVDAYRLRKAGLKIPRTELGQPLRARLVIARSGQIVGAAGREPYTAITASMHVRIPLPFPGHSEWPPLSVERVLCEDGVIMVFGKENVNVGLTYETHRQVWACRPVTIIAPS